MPAKVVDASVLGAVAFNEPEKAEALRLIGDAELYAPSLLAYELTSIARKKVIRHPEARGPLASALRDALSANLHWVEVDHNEALDLSVELGLSSYDAAYLWLARRLNAPLVTFDARLRAVAERTE